MVFLAKNYNLADGLQTQAGKRRVFSVKIISEKEGIPFDFLEKIISQLEREKLVKGKKGVQGGYFLAKTPIKISLADIVSSLEGKTSLVDCNLCGRSKKCISKNVWIKIENSLNKTLRAIKLKDLIK